MKNPLFWAVWLGLFVFGVNWFLYNGEGKFLNYFVPLADAFLHGRLSLLNNPAWLNELISWGGKYYVVYPPMPAILLMPAVAIFGPDFEQPLFSIFLTAINTGLCFLVIHKIFKHIGLSVWISFLYAFGTMAWYHGLVGSAWYIAHVAAMFFIWLLLLESVTKQRLWLVGLLLGGAYLSRLPAILGVIFILVYFYDRFITLKEGRLQFNFKNIILFGLGLAPAVFGNWLYNYLRYGTITDISYTLLPVFNEPWYQYGLFNIRYIPIHVHEIFTAMPKFLSTPPFLIPSWHVMALWFVTPAFLLIARAQFKQRIIVASALGALAMAVPGLAHGSNGFTQFGFRFALDYHPLLMILIASGLSIKLRWWGLVLIVLSIAINIWGIWMLYINKIYVM